MSDGGLELGGTVGPQVGVLAGGAVGAVALGPAGAVVGMWHRGACAEHAVRVDACGM